ncbi:MAG: YceI family protein [Ornithinimicrobium sp.]
MLTHIDHVERESLFNSAPHGTRLFPTGEWLLDTSRTTAAVSVSTFYIKRVRMEFMIEPGGSALVDDDGALRRVEVAACTGSISSGSASRDRRLKGPNFLDVENHPTITYYGSAKTALIGGVVRAKGRESQVSITATNASLLDDDTMTYSVRGTMGRDVLGLSNASSFFIGADVTVEVFGIARRA